MNSDGSIDSADALDVLRASVGLLDLSGTIKEEIHTLTLPYDGTSERTVRVYVPEHKEGETFPVIYMTDGQNVFESERSRPNCWNACAAVKEERESSGKAAIIVGINSADSDMGRMLELMPAEMGKVDLSEEVPAEELDKCVPMGEKFAEFVVNTVVPEVESNFPVKTGRENTAFCGSSSGGLETFYMGMAYPDVFSMAGAFSPVYLMYDKDDLEAWIRTKAAQEDPAYMYMYVGGSDELEKTLAVDFERVCGVMEDCYPESLLKKVVVPENRHHESSWRPIFKDFMHIFLENAD